MVSSKPNGGFRQKKKGGKRGKIITETLLKKRREDVHEEERALAMRTSTQRSKKADTTQKPTQYKTAAYLATSKVNEIKRKRQLMQQLEVNSRFAIDPTQHVLLVVRIVQTPNMPDIVRTALHLLKLPTIYTATFLPVTENNLNMLRIVEPYIMFGYPSREIVQTLITKLGALRIQHSTAEPPVREPIRSNEQIEELLGKHDIICLDDIVDASLSPQADQYKFISNALWPFRLHAPKEGLGNTSK
eukprot:CAMPEP_0117423988 /NCGR_PEP_ID=MMETSP0758-20121206/4505_1 /TAXON_ID=63605 /ORGANISM="Percolomonas cosmopolitus, Strain AE-1 (ATCC 50343)" /LENGTH=244 /DNA_ID=CAMNT_0005207513 /DNA_START=99 /DNA_END=830 /DNA_ORIENTATION=+